MQIKREQNGYIEVTLSLEEAMERLLPNIYDQDRLIVPTAFLNPLVFHLKGMNEQDIVRLEKEASYRNGPHWDRLLTKEDLTVRALNVLKAADIGTFGELALHNYSKLLKYRNVGKKTLHELEDLLERNGLSFIG